MSLPLPAEHLAAAIGVVQDARGLCTERPLLVAELDRALSRLASVRRALVGDSRRHELTYVALPHGVQAQCSCGWDAPLHAGGVAGSQRRGAWAQARSDGTDHVAALR